MKISEALLLLAAGTLGGIFSTVVSMPMVVDLPAPFGPSSPKNWPEPTDRSMPRTAGTSPREDL